MANRHLDPCRKCGSFAIQSLDHSTNEFTVRCFNEHSTDVWDCDADPAPSKATSQESIEAWNVMQRLVGETGGS